MHVYKSFVKARLYKISLKFIFIATGDENVTARQVDGINKVIRRVELKNSCPEKIV